MRIIGPATAMPWSVYNRIQIKTGVHLLRFTEMFWSLWYVAEEYGIDPVGAVAQMAKETGWGNFRGAVKPWHYNTCGLKVGNVTGVMEFTPTGNSDHSLCHAQFANWDIGAIAHIQHLRAYAGWDLDRNDAKFNTIIDPRYDLALRTPITGLTHFEDLGGTDAIGIKWAPSPTYGAELVTIADYLRGKS